MRITTRVEDYHLLGRLVGNQTTFSFFGGRDLKIHLQQHRRSSLCQTRMYSDLFFNEPLLLL